MTLSGGSRPPLASVPRAGGRAMNRRQFVASTLAAGVAAGAVAKDEAPLAIVDTHQHLWDLSKFRLPWVAKEPHLDHNFLMSDYLKEAKGLNIVKQVYMEVDVDATQQDKEAEYVLALCKKGDNPMAAAVISGR